MLSTLRQPRYAKLGALMVAVALICVAAGTWQIHRFEQKVHANDYLRANAREMAVPVARLLPLVGRGPAPSQRSVEFRRVSAVGTYDVANQAVARSRTIGDTTGYIVVTPLRTADGVLLVSRGFLAPTGSGGVPAIAAPPTGTVHVLARAHAPETRPDHAAQLPRGQVESINAREQAARLGSPTFDGYVELDGGQPGQAGLRALPKPDLSNPAGGAVEPQHFAYIIQWYLFALLALAAPFAMARAERKRDSGAEVDAEPEPVPDYTPEQARAAKLADRYGRVR